MTLSDRIALAEIGIGMAWRNRRDEQRLAQHDRAAATARRIRAYIKNLRFLDGLAARAAPMIAAE